VKARLLSLGPVLLALAACGVKAPPRPPEPQPALPSPTPGPKAPLPDKAP
jgi:hypothetical protein